MTRFSNFKNNTGWGGVLRTAFIFVFLVAACVLAKDHEDMWWVGYAGLGPFIATGVLQGLMTSAPGRTSTVLNGFGTLVFGFAMVAQFLRETIPDQLLAVAVMFLLGSYTGCFFWFWSHPDIERLEG